MCLFNQRFKCCSHLIFAAKSTFFIGAQPGFSFGYKGIFFCDSIEHMIVGSVLPGIIRRVEIQDISLNISD